MANFIVNTSGSNVDEFTTLVDRFTPRIIVSGLSGGTVVTFSNGITSGTATVDSTTYQAEYMINNYGTWTVTASTVNLSESISIDRFKYYHIYGIKILSQPIDYSGPIGDNAIFNVVAEGDNLSYQWEASTNGGNTWINSASTGNTTDTLTVGIIAARNGFLFRCKITDSNGNIIRSNAGKIIVSST